VAGYAFYAVRRAGKKRNRKITFGIAFDGLRLGLQQPVQGAFLASLCQLREVAVFKVAEVFGTVKDDDLVAAGKRQGVFDTGIAAADDDW